MSSEPAARLGLGDPLSAALTADAAELIGAELGVETLGEFLRHYPFRYESGTSIDAGKLNRRGERPPQIGSDVAVIGEIVSKRSVSGGNPRGRRTGPRVTGTIRSASDSYQFTFFNAWKADKELAEGKRYLMIGRLGVFRDAKQITQPEYVALPDGPDEPGGNGELDLTEVAASGSGTAGLRGVNLNLLRRPVVPIYRGTARLKTWQIMTFMKQVLDRLGPQPEPYPADTAGVDGSRTSLDTALRQVHFPDSAAAAKAAGERIAFDEAIAIQVALVHRKLRENAVAGPVLVEHPDGLEAALLEQLPFTLTEGQRRVGREIGDDLGSGHAMSRLLQGEVGSGKTVVALRAALRAIDGGYQAAFLAPTEVLASQHAKSMAAMLGPLGRGGELDAAPGATAMTLLTGSMSTAARKAALLRIVTGEAGIVIGTHAILEDTVEFFALGLIVVDEQHRFGVEQRDRLRAKQSRGMHEEISPHRLVMTATPIPRTAAMVGYGDLDTSSLNELPSGRKPITTHAGPQSEKWLARAFGLIDERIAAGERAYIVCARIGDPPDQPVKRTRKGDDYDFENLDQIADDDIVSGDIGRGAGAGGGPEFDDKPPPPISVYEMADMVKTSPLVERRVGILHGRLPAEEKAAVMDDFAAGRLDVLIATTVIEVGVDVPAATVMVIANGERFGISQLHQLRGRIGRGGNASTCILLSPMHGSGPASERLSRVASTLDGYELALADLEFRGPGDLLGSLQAGAPIRLAFLDLIEHAEIIGAAREAAAALLDADPNLSGNPAMRALLEFVLGGGRAEFLDKA